MFTKTNTMSTESRTFISYLQAYGRNKNEVTSLALARALAFGVNIDTDYTTVKDAEELRLLVRRNTKLGIDEKLDFLNSYVAIDFGLIGNLTENMIMTRVVTAYPAIKVSSIEYSVNLFNLYAFIPAATYKLYSENSGDAIYVESSFIRFLNEFSTSV